MMQDSLEDATSCCASRLSMHHVVNFFIKDSSMKHYDVFLRYLEAIAAMHCVS
jgi:hypothetical protein